jgi:hypothetical protein
MPLEEHSNAQQHRAVLSDLPHDSRLALDHLGLEAVADCSEAKLARVSLCPKAVSERPMETVHC